MEITESKGLRLLLRALNLLFAETMAMPTPIVRFMVGLWDKDPNVHKQRFEATCVVNEIGNDDKKLHIFLATLKDEDAS